MNKFNPGFDPTAPSRVEAKEALDTLRRLARLDPAEAADIGFFDPQPGLNRSYPAEFAPDAAYKATMPDLQNGPSSLIKGEKTEIQHVGISNFRLPLVFSKKDGGSINLETSVTGSVSLAAQKKGINMSRIMRSFYRHAEEPFNFEKISEVLDSYLEDLESFDARIQLRFRYPMLKESLRSGLHGFQYYDVAFEMLKTDGQAVRVIHLDYVYSSTCPCSLELAEHAREVRGQIATPHSQRSVARVSVALENRQDCLWIEDLVDLCISAIATETQVMVKREDEQAFAELNGSNPIFVEDAVRLLCEAMEGYGRIGDFRIAASQESLHSHDAVSVLTKGDTFAQASLDPRFFETLIHTG